MKTVIPIVDTNNKQKKNIKICKLKIYKPLKKGIINKNSNIYLNLFLFNILFPLIVIFHKLKISIEHTYRLPWTSILKKGNKTKKANRITSSFFFFFFVSSIFNVFEYFFYVTTTLFIFLLTPIVLYKTTTIRRLCNKTTT